MYLSEYERKRAKLLKDLRKRGVKNPGRLYPKVGIDDFSRQIDEMMAHVAENDRIREASR